MKGSNTKVVRNVLSGIVAIILMFSLIATMGIIFLKKDVVNESTYIKVFEKVGTYDNIYESIKTNVSYALTVNNIQNDILEDVISKEEINKVVNSTVDSLIKFISGKNTGIYNDKIYDIEVYNEIINTSLNRYLRDNGLYLDDEQKQDFENLKKSIAQIIDSELQIINFEVLTQSNAAQKISSLVKLLLDNMLLGILLLVDVLLGCIFFALWKTRKVRAYAWIGYSLVASGMIVFLISFSGYLSGFYDNVIIAIPYVAQTVAAVIKQFLLDMSIISGIFIIIGFAFMSVYWKHLYNRYSR